MGFVLFFFILPTRSGRGEPPFFHFPTGSWKKRIVTRFFFLLLLSGAGPFLSPVFPAVLSGNILDKSSQAPLPQARLVLEAEGDTGGAESAVSEPTFGPLSANPDSNGGFRVEAPDGIYRVIAAAAGFIPVTLSRVDLCQDAQRDFFLEPDKFTLPEVLVTAPRVPRTQVSSESISKQELTSVPGTAGDVLRAIQSFPGMAQASDFWAAPLVRGAGPLDNLTLVDGIPVAYPVHFGGLLSILNSDLVKSVDFYTGGYGPQYGDDYGGVIDVSQRDPRQDRWGGRFEITPLYSEAGLEGPLFPETSLVASGRRSYLELFSGLLSDFTAVPSFYDYQGKAVYDESPGTHWDFEVLGSGDNVAVNFQDGFSLEPDSNVLTGQFTYHNAFDSQGVRYRNQLGEEDSLLDTAYHTLFSLGVDMQLNYHLEMKSEDFANRLEWFHDFDGDTRLSAGWKYDHSLTTSDIYMNLLPAQDDLNPFVFPQTSPFAKGTYTAVSDNSALYLDQKFKSLDKKLEVSVGGRWDYQSFSQESQTSLRLSEAYALSERTTLKASYGDYYQLPFLGLYQSPNFGNPALEPELAQAVVVGLEQKLGSGLFFRLEGYHKALSQIMEVDQFHHYNNDGSGYSRGLEVFLRHYPEGGLFGWVSYSLSDSQRRDASGLALHPYTFDQPQIATVVAGYHLTSRWDTGLKWRYSTGVPYTPIMGSYLVKPGVYRAISGAEDSVRFPDYQQLDLSTSYQAVYPTWSWRVYLEIWNATNQQNILTYGYNADYTQRQAIYQLPLLPFLGLEVEF